MPSIGQRRLVLSHRYLSNNHQTNIKQTIINQLIERLRNSLISLIYLLRPAISIAKGGDDGTEGAKISASARRQTVSLNLMQFSVAVCFTPDYTAWKFRLWYNLSALKNGGLTARGPVTSFM